MTDVDPTLEILRERKAALEAEWATISARIGEVNHIIGMLEDGRSRVRRKMRGNSDGARTTPPDETTEAPL